jgi:hypothetical protein
MKGRFTGPNDRFRVITCQDAPTVNVKGQEVRRKSLLAIRGEAKYGHRVFRACYDLEDLKGLLRD